MRLWHYQLFPYLPEAQFRGQLRELVAIMHDWRDKGKDILNALQIFGDNVKDVTLEYSLHKNN